MQRRTISLIESLLEALLEALQHVRKLLRELRPRDATQPGLRDVPAAPGETSRAAR